MCCCCFYIIYFFCFYNYFIRDVRQPLSQTRLSVSMSLEAGQIIIFAGINATESKVSVLPFYPWNELTLCTVNILSKEQDENIKKPFTSQAACVTKAALMQYFLMAAFC